MKKFLVRLFALIAVCLVAAVSIVGLSGFSSQASVKAMPAKAGPPAIFGLGQGDCFYDGSFKAYSSKPSCVGLRPPPESKCNPNQTLTDTLAVMHEVRDKIDIGGFASFYLFQSDAGGCGSVWAGIHIDSGCHVVTNISIMDSFNGSTQGGLDANGVIRCANNNPWESTYMVDGESGSTATAKVTVDFVPEQTATVLV